MKVLCAVALLVLLSSPARAESSGAPTLSGSLAIAGATRGFALPEDRPSSMAVEAKVRVSRAIGHLSLGAEALHFLDNEKFFRDKSCARFGADVPLGRDALLFVTFERRYRNDDQFTLAGVKFTFTAGGS